MKKYFKKGKDFIKRLLSKVNNYRKKHPRRFYALAIFSTAVAVLLISASVVLAVSLFSDSDSKKSEDNFFEVLSTVPNENSAPHPVFSPIEITFSQKPDIDLEKLSENILLEPLTEVEVTFSDENDHKILVTPATNFEENTQYEVTIKAGYYGFDYILEEDYQYYFYTQGNFSGTVNSNTVVWTDSYYNDEHVYDFAYNYYSSNEPIPQNVDVTIYKTDSETLLNSLKPAIDAAVGDHVVKYVPDSNLLQELEKYNVEAEQYNRSWGISTELPIEDVGVYFMTLTSNNEVIKTNFVVLNSYGIASRSKYSDDESYLFAQDFKDSLKKPGVNVKSYKFADDFTFTNLENVTTDQNGLALGNKDANFVTAEYEGEFAIMNLNHYLNPWDGGIDWYRSYQVQSTEVYIVTDRPIYKPGDTIYYKLIGRERIDDLWVPLKANADMRLMFYGWGNDGGKKEYYNEVALFNDDGNAWGEIKIPENSEQGYLYLTVRKDDNYISSISVEVEDYNKPAYEISVETNKSEYKNGDTAKVTISANHYSGSPADGTKVKLQVNSRWLSPWNDQIKDECSDFYLYSWGDQADFYFTKEVVLGNNGQITVEVPIETDAANYIQKLNFEASISDETATPSVGSTTSIFFPSDVFIHTNTDSYGNSTNEDIPVNIQVLDSNCAVKNDVKLDYEVIRVTYEKEDDGTKFGYYTKKEEVVESGSVDVSGIGTIKNFNFDKQGSYRVVFKANSEKGEVTATRNLWVYDSQSSGSIYDIDGYSKQITFKLDKEQYQVGDIAKMTIFNPGIRGDVWISTHRKEIHVNDVVALNEYQTEYEFEITENYISNASVRLGIFVNNQFSTTSLGFEVDVNYKSLDYEISTDKEIYEPGETVSVDVESRNLGNLVNSELAIAVVDKSVLDLTEEPRTLLEHFYPYVYMHLSEYHSLSNININPYGAGGRGGGGGGARELFKDTAYWNPSLKLNNGTGSFSFELPDNLTKWAIVIWGTADGGVFGKDVKYITVNTPLAVQSFIPEELMQGDEVTVIAKVINGTDEEQDVTAEIEVTNEFSVNEDTRQIKVPARTSKKVEWNLKANQVGSNLPIYIRVNSADRSDAVKYQTRIVAKGYDYAMGTSFVGNGSTQITVENGINTLEVIASSDILGQIPSALKYLTGYPYGCSEQTSSKLYANTIPLLYSAELSGFELDSESKLRENIEIGLNKLDETQNPDGGFGWWEGQESKQGLTAHVLLTLKYAENSGASIPGGMLNKAKSYLESQGSKDAFAVYVLSLVGSDVSYNVQSAVGIIESVSNEDLVYLTLAAQNIGFAQTSEYVTELKSRLTEDAGMMYFTTTDSSNFYSSKDENVTGLALKALSVAGEKDTVDKMLLWLKTKKQGNYWGNTSATVYVVEGVLEYYRKYSVDSIQGTFSVKVDGSVVAENVDINSSSPTIIPDIATGNRNVEVVSSNASAFVSVLFKEKRSSEVSNSSNTLRLNTRITDENGNNISSLKVGEYGLFVIELESNTDVRYVLVENYIPSGLEPINIRLDNLALPDEMKSSDFYNDNRGYYHFQINDQKYSQFLYRLSGSKTIAIPVRGRTPGNYIVNSSKTELMYTPEIWDATKESAFKVE